MSLQQLVGFCRDIQDAGGLTIDSDVIRSICADPLSDEQVAEVLRELRRCAAPANHVEAPSSTDAVATAPLEEAQHQREEQQPHRARTLLADSGEEAAARSEENRETKPDEPVDSWHGSTADQAVPSLAAVTRESLLSAARTLDGVPDSITHEELEALAVQGQEQLARIPSPSPNSVPPMPDAAQELMHHRDAAAAAKASNLKKLQEEQAKLDERLRVLRCEKETAAADYKAAKERLQAAKLTRKESVRAAELLDELARKRTSLERKLESLGCQRGPVAAATNLQGSIQQHKDDIRQLEDVLNAQSVHSVESALAEVTEAKSEADRLVARCETGLRDAEAKVAAARIELKLQEETLESTKSMAAVAAQQHAYGPHGIGVTGTVCGLAIPIASSAVAAHFMKPDTNIAELFSSMCARLGGGLSFVLSAAQLHPYSTVAMAVGAMMLYAGYNYFFCRDRTEVALRQVSTCRTHVILLESHRDEMARSLSDARQASVDAEHTAASLTEQLSHLRLTQQQLRACQREAEVLQGQLAACEESDAGRQQIERELAALGDAEAPLLRALPLGVDDQHPCCVNPIAAAVELCEKAVCSATAECDRRRCRVENVSDLIQAMENELRRIQRVAQEDELAPQRATTQRQWRQNVAVS